jgi:hypothetical protein
MEGIGTGRGHRGLVAALIPASSLGADLRVGNLFHLEVRRIARDFALAEIDLSDNCGVGGEVVGRVAILRGISRRFLNAVP